MKTIKSGISSSNYKWDVYIPFWPTIQKNKKKIVMQKGRPREGRQSPRSCTAPDVSPLAHSSRAFPRPPSKVHSRVCNQKTERISLSSRHTHTPEKKNTHRQTKTGENKKKTRKLDENISEASVQLQGRARRVQRLLTDGPQRGTSALGRSERLRRGLGRRRGSGRRHARKVGDVAEQFLR